MNTPKGQRIQIIFWSVVAGLFGASVGYYIGAAEAAAKVVEFASR